jgi:hypothetical protein
MAEDLRDLPARSPAGRVAHEAIELAIEGRSPYPDKSMFMDAEEPSTGREIRRAIDEGMAVVLVYRSGPACGRPGCRGGRNSLTV